MSFWPRVSTISGVYCTVVLKGYCYSITRMLPLSHGGLSYSKSLLKYLYHYLLISFWNLLFDTPRTLMSEMDQLLVSVKKILSLIFIYKYFQLQKDLPYFHIARKKQRKRKVDITNEWFFSIKIFQIFSTEKQNHFPQILVLICTI